jgi:cold shock CspA family protein
MLKSNFGFVKCCERAEDIFFHFTAVEAERGERSEPRIGDEVEFAVAHNSATGRDHAVQIRCHRPPLGPL